MFWIILDKFEFTAKNIICELRAYS